MAENIMNVTQYPKHVIESKVDDCDAYIGIFDKRWGFVPEKDNPERLSVTAIEYERARTNNIPRLIMVSSSQKDKAMEDFIHRISEYETGNWRKNYDNFEELYRLVTRGIPQLENAVQSLRRASKNDDPFLMEPLHVIVSPSLASYGDKVEDISKEDIEQVLSRISKPANQAVHEAAWRSLEILARNRRIWKHQAVIEILDRMILSGSPIEQINDALFIVKGMVITSRSESSNEVILHIREHYISRFKELLSVGDNIWSKSKPDIQQILSIVLTENEKFKLIWEAIQACMFIVNNEEYSRSIAPFINDIENAKPELKKSILKDLFVLMESLNSLISRRAKEMHSFLFL